MGTRCDFYEGLGTQLVWAGAVARDGYEDVVGAALATSGTLQEYRRRKDELIAKRNGIPAEQGWPWPWKDSSTTDVAVTFAFGQLWLLDGANWVSYDEEERTMPAKLPDMVGPLQATPQGRVTLRFRNHSRAFGLHQDDVAATVLAELARRVFKVSLHFQRIAGGYRTTEADSAELFELVTLRQELVHCTSDLEAVIASRRTRGLEELDFSFLWWARDHLGDFMSGSTRLEDVTDETPLLFGLPLPRSIDEHRPERLKVTTYDGVVGRRLQSGLALLESLMPALGAVRTSVVLADLSELGRSVYEGASPREWANRPLEAFDGQSLATACENARSFETVRRFMQQRWLSC